MFSHNGENSPALVQNTGLQKNLCWSWTGQSRAKAVSPLHSSKREFLHLASRATVFSFFPVLHPEQDISLPGITSLGCPRDSSSEEGPRFAVPVWSLLWQGGSPDPPCNTLQQIQGLPELPRGSGGCHHHCLPAQFLVSSLPGCAWER